MERSETGQVENRLGLGKTGARVSNMYNIYTFQNSSSSSGFRTSLTPFHLNLINIPFQIFYFPFLVAFLPRFLPTASREEKNIKRGERKV